MMAKIMAKNIRKPKDGKYVGLKKAFQNENVSIHLPGVNFAANTPVIMAIVNQEATPNAIPKLICFLFLQGIIFFWGTQITRCWDFLPLSWGQDRNILDT